MGRMSMNQMRRVNGLNEKSQKEEISANEYNDLTIFRYNKTNT